jgi:hypothetical protein
LPKQYTRILGCEFKTGQSNQYRLYNVGKNSLLKMKFWFRPVDGGRYELVSIDTASGSVVTISNQLRTGNGERAVLSPSTNSQRQRFTVSLHGCEAKRFLWSEKSTPAYVVIFRLLLTLTTHFLKKPIACFNLLISLSTFHLRPPAALSSSTLVQTWTWALGRAHVVRPYVSGSMTDRAHNCGVCTRIAAVVRETAAAGLIRGIEEG